MHWLDCIHAPASVCVVRSKISIALLVPVMVAFAVAVRIALLPACRNPLPASSSRRCAGAAGRSVESGTLGVTSGAAIESPRLTAAVGTESSVAAGQGAWPSGVDATPGAIVAAGSCVLHAAPGPDAGHCSAPDGTLRLTSSAGAAGGDPWRGAAGGTAGAAHRGASMERPPRDQRRRRRCGQRHEADLVRDHDESHREMCR